MPVIAIASTKGGAGKTTLARLLLGHAAQHGLSAAGLDCDLNHSLADWLTHDAKVPITSRTELREGAVLPAVAELRDAHQLVVIDTPGASSKVTTFGIGAADLVLVPCRLSSSDVIEAVKTVKEAESIALLTGEAVPVRVVLMAYKPRTLIAKHVEEELAAAKLSVLTTRIDNLVPFEELTFSGVVPMNGTAGMQTANLFDEVMSLLPEDERPRRAAA